MVSLSGRIGLFAMMAWTAALPFAQIQKTRFTSVFLFVLLGAFLIRFAFQRSFRIIPKDHQKLCWAFLLFTLFPLLDFFRWESAKAGEEAVLLRLPFLVLPFLVVQFEKDWPFFWRKLAISVLLFSFLLCHFLIGLQGVEKVYAAARTDFYPDIRFYLHRPYTGLIAGIFLWLAFGIFRNNLWRIAALLVFGGLQFWVLSKFSLLAFSLCLVVYLYFSLPAGGNSRKVVLVMSLLAAGFLAFRISRSQAFKELISTGGIDFNTVSKTYSNSINNRSLLWQAAFQLLARDHNWVFGLGTGNFQDLLDAEVGKYNDYLPGQHLNPHNIFLYYGLQYGLAGFALLIFFLLAWTGEARQSGKRHLVYMAIFMLLCCQTEIFLDRELGIQLFLWVAVVLFRDRQATVTDDEPPFFQS